MTQLEKIDYTLLGIYEQNKKGGLLRIIEAFEANKQELTIEELQKIKKILEKDGYAVFQTVPKGADYKGRITPEGIVFVENDSYSKSGTSILKL